jgi:hypothetical protein
MILVLQKRSDHQPATTWAQLLGQHVVHQGQHRIGENKGFEDSTHLNRA